MTSRRSAISEIPIIATLLIATPVLGGDLNCQTEYGDVELDANLTIAAPCKLNGTTVNGNISLFAGGSLVAIDAVIDGNIKADTADFIDLQNSEVDGNVSLDEMVGDISYIRDSTIDGNVKLNKNRSRLELHRNYIDSNLQAFENSGGVVIIDNVIDGNLLCDNNSPAPDVGNKKNQCSGFQAATDTGGSGSDGGTGTTGGSEPPPFEVNVGAGGGGGGSTGPLLILYLLVVGLVRLRRYGMQYRKSYFFGRARPRRQFLHGRRLANMRVKSASEVKWSFQLIII